MRLELQGLTRHFPGTARPAVDNFSLVIPAGTTMVLAGPSGCGKTTLLRLIAGLEQPDAGDILADGQTWHGLPPERRPVALVFQNGALFPHLTVRENLTLGLVLRKTPPPQIAARLAEIVNLLGLSGLLGRWPEHLSGGERQRVALGRALIRRPQLLLLDEPLAGLDAPQRRALRGEMIRLCRPWVPTLLWVTHDQEEALEMADWLGIMHAGRLLQCGPPAEVCLRPANPFVAQFLAPVLTPRSWPWQAGAAPAQDTAPKEPRPSATA
ncbi:MAG: ABC transporter ATP-binding protein [Verrucomicrobiae bacterium]|nr:ABC transporter ATP-binding protein [Verrucomicrobiae bacterium]